jgi:dienelactone hydrolase
MFDASFRTICITAMALLSTSLAGAAIRTETVEYQRGATPLQGLLVYDTAVKGKRPGVLLASDWMGVSDQSRRYAEKTAKLGYVVFVADIYGKGVHPRDFKEAGTQAAIYRSDRALMQARAQAGLDQLLRARNVDPARVAAQGYCFGGGVVLELARSGANLAGVVSFHGSLETPHPEQAKNIKGKVLVLHGADDPIVTQDEVRAFIEEMRQAGVDWRLTQFGGAVHSFTNPTAGSDNSKGAAYNARADERSWEEATLFYKEIFAAARH